MGFDPKIWAVANKVVTGSDVVSIRNAKDVFSILGVQDHKKVSMCAIIVNSI